MADLSDPIAILRVSAARRVFGAVVQGGLGLLLLVLAVQLPEPTVPGRLALIGFGLLSLWQALVMYRATGRDLVLTKAGLFDSAGEPIAALDNIASVDRGFFALKPSNGFLLRLHGAPGRRWVPGLWWRLGTRVGVGGATSGKAARDMADIIALMKADPDGRFLDPDPD
ncbi:MAG: hypothetical protein AAGE76_07750 [Pseudomonadota bacterium]